MILLIITKEIKNEIAESLIRPQKISKTKNLVLCNS